MKAGRRIRRHRQALTELAVCLVAILTVISGMLLISGLGIRSVRNLIQARQEADRKARDGFTSSGGTDIRYWSYGADKLPFTRDDTAVSTKQDVSGYFLGELDTNDEEDDADDELILDLRHTGTLAHIPASNNFAKNTVMQHFFLSAATLAGHTESDADPLASLNLSSLRQLIRKLLMKDDFSLSDTVFIPSNPVITGNQY